MQKGAVYLVGAGCGDAELITVRGLRLLQGCDAVVYDDLIAPELLSAAPAGAERVYMGKRSGCHSASQREINAALIANAEEGKTVVRLKGGDPFVFGRGGEELEALRAAGIPCEEIPGISSAIAIPAAAGIPVTHRGVSRSFHVITAHTADTEDGLPENLEALAALSGTLVFLMGLSKLPLIASRLITGGLPPDTPAAVISGGNSPNKACVRAALSCIASECGRVGMRSPAVIVVGQTAGMDLSTTIDLPLSGVRVAVTGTDAVASRLREALRELGADAFAAERSVLRELPMGFDLTSLRDRKCVLVFTSGNGVRIFFKRLAEQGVDIRSLYRCSFAVIGAATGEQLAAYGVRSDICPAKYTAAALAEAIQSKAERGLPVYIFRSAMASSQLADDLSEMFEVTDVRTYDLAADPDVTECASARLDSADYICFCSAGGVKLFLEQHGAIPERARCVSIGEVTSSALREAYGEDFAEAREISVKGMVEAILADAKMR